MIPIHATATANPQQLRWVVAADRLPARGVVRLAPGRLGTLLGDGVIDQIEVRPADVVITLHAGNSWREWGDDVRQALCDALLDPAGWNVDSRPRRRRAGRDRRRTTRRTDRRARRIPWRLDRIGVGRWRQRERPIVGRVPRLPGGRRHPARQAAARAAPTVGPHGVGGRENDSVAVPLGRKLLSLIRPLTIVHGWTVG